MKLLQKMNCKAFHILTLFTILVFFYSCATASANYIPTEGWQSSTPEEQGMHSQKLADMMEVIKKNGYNVDSVLIIRNGYIVLDAYFYPFSKGQRHVIHSSTKSIMSALVVSAFKDNKCIYLVVHPMLNPEKFAEIVESLRFE